LLADFLFRVEVGERAGCRSDFGGASTEGGLDQDDIGTEVREEAAGERAGPDAGEIEDADAGERAVSGGFVVAGGLGEIGRVGPSLGGIAAARGGGVGLEAGDVEGTSRDLEGGFALDAAPIVASGKVGVVEQFEHGGNAADGSEDGLADFDDLIDGVLHEPGNERFIELVFVSATLVVIAEPWIIE
jgi:hypothetical protein